MIWQFYHIHISVDLIYHVQASNLGGCRGLKVSENQSFSFNFIVQ